jgi:hypothetical protein
VVRYYDYRTLLGNAFNVGRARLQIDVHGLQQIFENEFIAAIARPFVQFVRLFQWQQLARKRRQARERRRIREDPRSVLATRKTLDYGHAATYSGRSLHRDEEQVKCW